MSIKAVLFDLDDTLIERSLSVPETFHKILNRRGIQVPIKEIEQALLEVKKDLEDAFEEQYGKIPLLEFHNTWNFHVLKALEIEDPDGDISREAYEQWINLGGIEVCPDAKSTLTTLRHKGIKTGIISGGYEEEIQKMLEAVGLDESLFDVIVGSNTIKKRKPDPEVFRYALRVLGIEPEEAIFVGDDLERDYKAAKRVGMKPFMIVKTENTTSGNVRKIKSLMSLIDYLDR
jgi:putative hydrolase of the HAD superfamily